MRLFLAFLPDENMVKALKIVQDRLKEKGMKGRYSQEWNLHLTAAFIGEYPDDEAVLEAVSEIESEPLSIRLEGYGCFGSTVWAGVAKNEELLECVRKIRRALAAAGIPFDNKPFKPHFTLVRGAHFGDKLPGIMVPAPTMAIREVTLMRSDRGKSGMNYTAIGSIPFIDP